MQSTKNKTVAVLYGGASPERAVSLRSGDAVATALDQAGYSVIKVDTKSLSDIQLRAALKGCDVVFPVLHGVGGEDGSVQSWLESESYRYVGPDSVSSSLCFDKARYKKRVMDLGVTVPTGEIVNSGSFRNSKLIQRPFVLKPYDGGSSVDTFIVRAPKQADVEAMLAALIKYDSMLLEELIDGIEITVGVLANEALPVIEIIPPADGEFDYENKYNGKTQELCPPQHVSQEIQHEAQQIAERISRELNVRDMSRTDLMIRRSDSKLFVLETNTIPGMTDQSLLPKAAATAGYSMSEMVDKLVQAALAR